MSNHIDGSRNSCALHGALLVIEAIDGAVPVIHSNAGCGFHYFLGLNRLNAGGDAFGGPPVSSSNISEKHVVFGGSSRLREQLKNTIKVVEADLYFIVSGCSTEMVGDDIPAMTKEGREQDFPVIYANTPGFRGDVHQGYQIAAKALVEQLPELLREKRPRAQGVVNLWGIIPHQDPFWAGNLEQIGRLMEGIGLKPNLLLGYGQDLDGWHRVPDAELNIVVSIWGETTAALLEERYGTPAITLGGLPVGAAAGRMLRAVSDKLGLEAERTERFIQAEESRLNRHLGAFADTYYRAGFQRDFALVGESAQVVGLSEFLTYTLGMVPRTLVITDNPSGEAKSTLHSSLSALVEGWGAELFFDEDHAAISALVRSGGAGLVLGSALEEAVADELGVPFLQVSFPLSGRVVLNRGYAGYQGATALLEDLGSLILSHALNVEVSSPASLCRTETVYHS
ncbi:MAG: oxalate:formate antiporter [Chlorobiaceae bacterium]|nr:oxalate:formate antiporter [Chlorobiaceae bacterium]